MQSDNLPVSNGGRTGSNRYSYQQTYHNSQHAEQVHCKKSKSETENRKPVFRYDLAAGFHGIPELHPVIDNEMHHKHITDRKINAGQDKQEQTDADKNACCQTCKEQRKKIVEAFEKIAELQRFAREQIECCNSKTCLKRSSSCPTENRAERSEF